MLSERMDKVSQYRGNAQECRRLCASVTDSQQKAMLERMAETWESLAADRERRAAQKQRIADLEGPDGEPSGAS
jgi:hypothetical protein